MRFWIVIIQVCFLSGEVIYPITVIEGELPTAELTMTVQVIAKSPTLAPQSSAPLLATSQEIILQSSTESSFRIDQSQPIPFSSMTELPEASPVVTSKVLSMETDNPTFSSPSYEELPTESSVPESVATSAEVKNKLVVSASPTDKPSKTPEPVSSTQKPEHVNPQESQPNFVDFMDNNILFSLELYKKINELKDGGNTFFSPMSIFSTLLMLHYGARGSTAEEMSHTLGLDTISDNIEVVHKVYGSIMEDLANYSNSDTYVLMANSIFLNVNFEILKSYQDGVKMYYNTSVESVDFNEPLTTDLINEWVSHKTKGHIEKLFKSTLPGSTSAVLLNAMYFNGDWQYEFHPTLTVDNINFFLDSQTTVNVSMMVNKVKLAYADNKELGVSILELPYTGDILSMFIFLPNETTSIEEVEAKLTIDTLKSLLRSMKRRIINIRLPKFKMSDNPPLLQSFASMGMKSLFSSSANLTGMAENGLMVSNIQHQATIEVTESGSYVSAATGVILERLGSSFESYFEVQKPFMFFIIDKQNGLILFIGKVKNPTL